MNILEETDSRIHDERPKIKDSDAVPEPTFYTNSPLSLGKNP